MTSSQMLKGVLEGCVLALIGRGETYGYELVGALAAYGLPGIAEGTLYPLLMRLEKKGLIASTYRESEVGPRRKYYRITEEGVAEVASFAEEFARLSAVVKSVLGEGREPAVNRDANRIAGTLSAADTPHAGGVGGASAAAAGEKDTSKGESHA